MDVHFSWQGNYYNHPKPSKTSGIYLHHRKFCTVRDLPRFLKKGSHKQWGNWKTRENERSFPVRNLKMLPESQGKVMEFGSVMGKSGKIISENINKF